MSIRLFILILSLFPLAASMAQEVKTIEGEFTFTGDGRLSPAECKRLAAESARIEALQREFGTIISQDIMLTEAQRGDNSSTHFLALSSSEVKGEWLGDIGEPVFTTSLDKNDNLVVQCKLKGRARQLSNKAVDFEALVLRNGTDRRNADTRFRDGDDLYLYFSAPVNGYLTAYLADESGEVFGLLPYSTGDVDEIKIKRGYDYIFFDSNRGSDFGLVDEFQTQAKDGEEYNKVYVIFSPEPFAPAPVKFKNPGMPPSISGKEFNNWLIKSRRNDPRMGVKSMNILISPQ